MQNVKKKGGYFIPAPEIKRALRDRRRDYQEMAADDPKRPTKGACFYPKHVKGTAEMPVGQHNTHIRKDKS